MGNTAEAGATLRLRFTFVGGGGELGARTVTIAAPPAGETRSFEVSFAAPAAAYHYSVVAP